MLAFQKVLCTYKMDVSECRLGYVATLFTMGIGGLLIEGVFSPSHLFIKSAMYFLHQRNLVQLLYFLRKVLGHKSALHRFTLRWKQAPPSNRVLSCQKSDQHLKVTTLKCIWEMYTKNKTMKINSILEYVRLHIMVVIATLE